MELWIVLTVVLGIGIPLALWLVIRRYIRAARGMSPEKQRLARQLMATGRKARATVVGIQPTGVIINRINLQCLVDFQLEPIVGGAPFSGQKKMLISQVQMPRVGDVWPAWYDGADHTKFAVAMPAGATPDQIPLYRQFGIPHPLD